jgi:hypothetical protein
LNLPGYAHISDSDLEAIRDIIMDGLQGFPAGEFSLGSAARGEFEISSGSGVKILSSDSVRRHVVGEHKRPLDRCKHDSSYHLRRGSAHGQRFRASFDD